MDRRSVIAGVLGVGVAPLLGACLSAPATAAASDLDLASLEAGGRLGLFASSSLGQVSWRGAERFLYCSTFKAFLAAATLERVQRGEERLDRPVPVTQADIVFHAPVTESFVGGAATVERLCQAAVEVSDNTAANLLIRELGGLSAFQAWYRRVGDDVTRVDRWETALNHPDGDLDTTTPRQTVSNLEAVLVGAEPVLDAEQRELLAGWMMSSPTGAERIRAGVPAGWTVAHKTGTSGTIHANDIGIIHPPSGPEMLLAIYYEGAEGSSAEQRDAVIAEATRRALGALGHV